MGVDDDRNAREASLYERAPCGLMSTTHNGVVTTVNATLCDWLGFAKEDILNKRRFQDLLTMGSRIFHQTHWLPLLQMQGSVAEVQFEVATASGRIMPVLVNALRVEHEGIVRHDIAVFLAADRRKFERELIMARKQAEDLLTREREAREALSVAQASLQRALEQRATLAEQLIGIVSHDLRTPMSSIVMGANMLSGSELSPRDQRTVQRVATAAARATRLIDDLLDFTQARVGGGLRIQLAEANLAELVNGCIEELKVTWPGRMIEQRIHVEGVARVDADRLAQVIINLVNNAMTYGDPQSAVRVTAEASGGRVSITVHNFGTPIPDSLLPHLFEPMRRGEQQVKLGSRSVGLGLFIVREILLAHAGTVTVTSTQDEGTSFAVTIAAP